jgi:hypothetical protein
MRQLKLGKTAVVKIKGRYFCVLEFELGEEYLDKRITELLSRYPKQTVFDIQAAIECFKKSRKFGRISRNIVRKVLNQWLRFSVAAVSEGVQIYLGIQDHAEKGEAYCTGIIRRLHKSGVTDAVDGNDVVVPPNLVTNRAAEVQKRITEEFRKRGGGDLKSIEEANELRAQIIQELANV